MTTEKTAHIEPSKHSTDEVDKFLNTAEANIEDAPGAGSPAIMPNTNLNDDGQAPAAHVVAAVPDAPALTTWTANKRKLE